MKKITPYMLHISIASLGLITINQAPIFAQVSSDGTVNTQVNQDGNVSEVTGGETRGSNLFHSFQDFSVNAGNEAFFNNATDVGNIFSRVTGGNISNIDGAIRANGSANLFLINPAGVIFGEGSSLDIGGSFYGSSASSILFEEGEFSAADLENPPLLTVNAPIGLGFRDNPGDIINRSNFGLTTSVLDENFGNSFAEDNFTIFSSVGLQVNPGQTFALVGGNVVLENMAGITASEGMVELGGISEAGTVSLTNNGSLIYPEDITRGDVSLTEDSLVEVRGDSGGSVNINANNLSLTGQSKIFAGIAENSGSIDAQAGDITINATNSVELVGNGLSSPGIGTEINNHVGTIPNRREGSRENPSNASGNGGNIIVNTSLLEISEQARIFANSYSQGNGGNVTFNTDNITINGGAFGGFVFEGTGDAGNVIINNTNDIVLNEGSNIQSQILSGAEGNAGDITINTGSLNIKEKFSFILADHASEGNTGNAGNININASDVVFIDGGGGEDLGETLSAIISQIQNDVIGDAGDITISTPELSLTNFALISSNVKEGSVGTTGDISLDVGTLRLNNGSVIDALTENEFDGGNIVINADVVDLQNGGKIVTSGDGGGNAGSINLTIEDNLTISSDKPPTETPFEEAILENSASESGLFSSTLDATGNAGSIEVQANSIQLGSNSLISATSSSGTGGNVILDVNETISLRENSLISAQANNSGNGGNINIDTNFIIAFPGGNSDILANAEQGQGGNINITAESLLGIRERSLNDSTNDINASSEFSLDGNVNINTPDLNPIQGATELPQNVVEPQKTTAQACRADSETSASNQLIVSGRGGLSTAPGNTLNSANVMIDGEVDSSIAQSLETSQGQVQPARGVKVMKSGEVRLTSYTTDNSGNRVPSVRRNCKV